MRKEIRSQCSRNSEFTMKQNKKHTKLVKSQQDHCWDSTVPTHWVRSIFPIKPSALICMWYKSSELESCPQYDLDMCTHAFLGPSGCQVWMTSPWARRVTSTGVGPSSRAWAWQEANCSGICEAVFELVPIHSRWCHGEGRTGQQNWKPCYFLITELNNVVSDMNEV